MRSIIWTKIFLEGVARYYSIMENFPCSSIYEKHYKSVNHVTQEINHFQSKYWTAYILHKNTDIFSNNAHNLLWWSFLIKNTFLHQLQFFVGVKSSFFCAELMENFSLFINLRNDLLGNWKPCNTGNKSFLL